MMSYSIEPRDGIFVKDIWIYALCSKYGEKYQ